MAGQDTSKDTKKGKEPLPFLRPGLFVAPLSSEETPHLIGSRCKLCGRVFFPKRTVCFDCKHLDTSTMEEVHLSLKGKLHTGLFVHAAPEGFKTPYAIGFIDLPEGVRVFSQLVGENLSDEVLTAGREAEMIIEKIREDEAGNDVVAYKFKVI